MAIELPKISPIESEKGKPDIGAEKAEEATRRLQAEHVKKRD